MADQGESAGDEETTTNLPSYDPGPITTRTTLVQNKYGRRQTPIRIVIPTDAEIRRIALELHARQVPTSIKILGWSAAYVPSSTRRWEMRSVDFFTGEEGEDVTKSEFVIAPRFFLLVGKPGYIKLEWSKGEDQPPERFDTADVCPEGAIVVQEELNFEARSDQSPASRIDAIPLPSPTDDGSLFEGSLLTVDQDVYERNPEARRACLAHYGRTCFACAFDFGATFGAFADGFIHVHHVVPLSTIEASYRVDPIRDLRPLCPNCHAAVHLRDPVLTPEELRGLIQSPGKACP